MYQRCTGEEQGLQCCLSLRPGRNLSTLGVEHALRRVVRLHLGSPTSSCIWPRLFRSRVLRGCPQNKLCDDVRRRHLGWGLPEPAAGSGRQVTCGACVELNRLRESFGRRLQPAPCAARPLQMPRSIVKNAGPGGQSSRPAASHLIEVAGAGEPSCSRSGPLDG